MYNTSSLNNSYMTDFHYWMNETKKLCMLSPTPTTPMVARVVEWIRPGSTP